LREFSHRYVTLGELVRTRDHYPKSLVTMFSKAGLTPVCATESKRVQAIYFREQAEAVSKRSAAPARVTTFQSNGLTGLPRRSDSDK
jgi:hypothetical protein